VSEEEDRPDLLVSETVDDLRQVFMVENAFPTEWEPDASGKKEKATLRSIGSWICRSLGIGTHSGEKGRRDDDS